VTELLKENAKKKASVATKLALLAGGSFVLFGIFSMGTSYLHLSKESFDRARLHTEDAAELISYRVESELSGWIKQAETFAANFSSQKNFKEKLPAPLWGLSLYRTASSTSRTHQSEASFNPVTLAELEALDLRYPLNFELAHEKRAQVSFAQLSEHTSVLRVFFPLKDSDQFASFVISSSALKDLARGSQNVLSFILDSNGYLVSQSNAHFVSGEKLSHLPVFRKAHEAGLDGRSLSYIEFPGKKEQVASFQNIYPFGLTVISQVPKDSLKSWTVAYAKNFGLPLAMAFALLSIFLFVSAKTLTDWRVRKLKAFFKNPTLHHFSEDEIQDDLGDSVGGVISSFRALERSYETERAFKKFSHEPYRSQINDLSQRKELFSQESTLACFSIHYPMNLGALSQEDYLDFEKNLNELLTEATALIHSSGGYVELLSPQILIASWNLFSSTEDEKTAERQILLCTRRIQERMQSSISVSVGIHTGKNLVGNFGTPKRKEYGLLGECIHLAMKLSFYAKEWERPVLLSESFAEAFGDSSELRRIDRTLESMLGVSTFEISHLNAKQPQGDPADEELMDDAFEDDIGEEFTLDLDQNLEEEAA
jgi:hypothetical protein